MDQLYHGLLYLFILSTATLFTDIKSTTPFSHDWFDAQNHCLGHGLILEDNRSDQPYWTGVYRRLSPWIKILGCYPENIESVQGILIKTMIMSSVGMCQDICYHENIYKFAVKMKKCLCIGRDFHVNQRNQLSALDCNYSCDNKSDDIYSRECGGKNAYNIFEIQKVELESMEECLSLQCSTGEPTYIPQKCSTALKNVCGSLKLPDNGYASDWHSSMQQCKKSQPSTYLLGGFHLNNLDQVCAQLPNHLQLVWVGVARQIYKNIDQGWEIKEDQKETFLGCQMCTKNGCQSRPCTDLSNSSIFCKSIASTSKSQITERLTTLQGSVFASSYVANYSTTKQLFTSTSTTKLYDEDQLAINNDMKQKSSTTDELALKISLPVTIVFTISLLCALSLVFYRRRKQITKTDRTTKEEVDSVRKTTVHSESNYIQDDSYFELEQCSQKISKGSDSVYESPYNESEEGVYDHLRNKQARKPEVEDTYQHASVGVSTDLSEYDTMANAHNKNQEEESSYDFSHTDKNKDYKTDLRAQNHLTDNPYDVAV